MKKIFFPITVVGFYALTLGLGWICADDGTSFTRKMMHDFHNQESIDVLFLGASHVFRGIDTSVADQKFQKNTFAAGTPQQQVDGSFALLQKAAKLYNIEKVFMDLDFVTCTSIEYKDRTELKSTYVVSTYLRDPLVKAKYLIRATSPKYYLNSLLPIGKDKLIDIDPESIMDNLALKFSGKYYSYLAPVDYKEKGSLLSEHAYKRGGIYIDEHEPPFLESQVSDSWKHVIRDIALFCKKNQIEIIFYSIPETDFLLADKGNYDDYICFVKKYLQQFDCKYYDFNLCKENMLKLEDTDFRDENHLNASGAKKFTTILCDFYNGDISETDLFYNSFVEKLSHQPDCIYGLLLEESEDRHSSKLTAIVNKASIKNNITYTVEADFNGCRHTLIEKSLIDTIFYPKDADGTIYIKAFLGDEQTNQIDFDFNTHWMLNEY